MKLPPNLHARSYRTARGVKRTLYYVRFKDWQGVRRKFPAGDNLAYAKELRDELMTQNRQRQNFDAPPKPAADFSTWAEHWLTLTAHKRSHGKDRISVARLKEFFGTCLLVEISTSRSEAYKQWRHRQVTRYGTPPKPATINRELACLRALLVLAVEDQLLATRPAIHLIREHNERDRIATEAEYHALLPLLPTDLQPVLIILWEMGSRITETTRLAWARIDLQRQVLEFIETKTDRRTVPMSPAVYDLLSRLPQEHERVFSCSRHRFRWYFKKACDQAGIRDLWVHDIRRTFVTRKEHEGWSWKKIMLITGHKDLKSFDRYNKPDFESLREVLVPRQSHKISALSAGEALTS